MKLLKSKTRRFDDDGWTEIIRSELAIGVISLNIRLKIDNLKKFILVTQKGERQLQIQTRKFIKRYSKTDEQYKPEYYLYLNAVEYAILELNRLIEVHHHKFISHISDDFQIDLLKSPKFDFCKKELKGKGIYISKIEGYDSMQEVRKICNDLKHSYIKEYSLSKTLELNSFREFDRKILVDKVNKYFSEIPKYIKLLAKEINKKYPKIENKIITNPT